MSDALEPGNADEVLFSGEWHRVRDLRPALAADVQVVRHVYRERSWHLLHRPSIAAHHRLDSLAWDLISRFDGERRVEDVWQEAHRTHGAEAPTQPALLRLLAALHEADLLVVDRTLDAERLFRRGRETARRGRRERLASPLYLRFALGDPGPILVRLEPWTRWLFTRGAAWAGCVLLLAALVRLVPEWRALGAELAAFEVFSPTHVAGFACVYVSMKLVHEFAHASTVHRHGGRVREMGIALMVLLPNPYTDARDATLFPGRRQRMQVSAAGIVAELGIASLGALIWSASAGPVHDVALMAMLAGGLSTLLFNGNPLLKFDGYHVLADALEIPNLAERSRRRVRALAARLFLGLPDTDTTALVEDRGERAWLVGYGVAASLYRVLLMIGIAWLLSGRWFFVGGLLALYVVITSFVVPVFRLLRFVHALSPDARVRGTLGSALPLVALVAFVTLVPLPRASVADGVVWLPDAAVVRAAHLCDVVERFVDVGDDVRAGTPLLRCEDAELVAERARGIARVRELVAEKAGLVTREPVRHAALARQLADARAALALTRERLDAQLIRSATDGRFSIEGRRALVGQHFAQGETVAWVIPPRARTVRVALTQESIGRVERSVERVDVALAQHPDAQGRFESRVVRRTPRPTAAVTHAALTQVGGGRLAPDPDGRADQSAPRLAEPAFDVELAWSDDVPESRVGGAARVRFVHPAEPLLARLLDGIRRTLMGRASA